MKTSLAIAGIVLACVIVILVSTILPYQKAVATNVAAGAMAPDFPAGLDWLNTDHPVSLKDLRGKVVLLDFWTYCCINCMHVIPDLKKLEAKYHDELVVIGVHSAKFTTERGTDNIRQAILRYELAHPVVNDNNFQIWQSYGVNAWPTFVFIDPDGRVAARYSGEGVYGLFDDFIGRMVKEFDKQGKIDRRPITWHLERDKVPQTLLRFPGKLAADPAGQRLYVADSDHNRIVIIDPKDGSALDVVGDGTEGLRDGTFATARFFRPQGLAVDGHMLYVADTENHAIRAVDLQARTVTTLAGTGEQSHQIPNPGGRGRAVELNSPWDLLVHDGKLYIAMAGPHQLWTLDLKTLDTRPFAGSGRENIEDGALRDAALAQPSGITTDGKKLYFADSEVSAVRMADFDRNGKVQTIIGKGLFEFGDRDGPVADARLQHPLGVSFHDGAIYVADTYNSKIKRIDLAAGRISTLIGTGKPGFRDGPADQAQLAEPGGLTWIGEKLYIADTNNHLIRIFDPKTNTVSTLDIRQPQRLMASATTRKAFSGAAVKLPAQTVAPGNGTIELSVELPDGCKINPDAPFYLAIAADNPKAIALAAGLDEQNIERPMFPMRIPATFAPAQTSLTLDLVVYYCREGEEGLCMVKPLRATVPLQVSNTAASHTVVAKVDLKGIPNQ